MRRSSWLYGMVVYIDRYRAIIFNFDTSNNLEAIVDADSDSGIISLLINSERTGNVPTASSVGVGVRRRYTCGLYCQGSVERELFNLGGDAR
jgi:hypothetical protein